MSARVEASRVEARIYPSLYTPEGSTYRPLVYWYKSIFYPVYKTMETVGYCFRVQALEGYAEKLRAMTLTPDYTALVSVRHAGKTGENPHYHGVVRTGVNPQAFRVRMKKTFPDGKGNQHMSIVPWDGDDKALSYLFHEDPECTLIARKGLTDDRLVELRAKNDAIQVLVKQAKQKASWTLEEDAYQYFLANPPHAGCVLQEKAVASRIYLIALQAGKYPPQPWLIRSMVIKVLFRMKHGELAQEEKYCDKLAEMLYRD